MRTFPEAIWPELEGGKELLVGSIFTNTSLLQQQWLDLQLRFLRATTRSFDHVAYISQDKANGYFKERTTVIPRMMSETVCSKQHVLGLHHLLNFFKYHEDKYGHFLFLDMDAFPIHMNWIEVLKMRMKGYREIAIPVRYENQETRLHSSIIFAKPAALKKMNWCVGYIGEREERDVRLDPYQEDQKLAFTLLRSNQFNRHPLYCGIYYDLFFHHNCGSGERFLMNATSYWDHIAPESTRVMETIDELMDNPAEFISKLAGWNPQHYPKEV
jgi:hypothetical protein